MPSLHLRTKALLLGAGFAALFIAASLYVYFTLEESTEEVIRSHQLLTEAAAHELGQAGQELIDSLHAAGVFLGDTLSKGEETAIDGALAAVTLRTLAAFQGMEGGYYFISSDRFFGYAFPTSPPPLPAFGPPPRSYSIIRDQVRQTIAEQRQIGRLHQFDPATFPLVTSPVTVRGSTVGAVWARVHIERLLPTVRLTSVLIVAAVVSLAGLIVVIIIAWRLRRHTEEIRIGLDTLHRNSAFRFPERRGVFGTIMRSINDMVAARAEDQRVREELERELHQQDKMASLGKLVARVAHEVKTPLAVIKTRVQMWQRKMQRSGDGQDHAVVSPPSMSLVVREIDRLSDLVKRLLAFSKPAVNTFARTNLHSLLRQSLAVMQPEAEEKGVAVATDFDPRIPAVALNAQAIEQVILNICQNALEAMPQGGCLRVTTALDEPSTSAVITIQDTGVGIGEQDRSRIFEPFFTTKDHGSGLGLSIAYEIVRAHGGRIEFFPNDGKGTVCRIQVPVHGPEAMGAA